MISNLPQPTHIRGTFDVQMTPLPLEFSDDAAQFSRFALDKVYHGELSATAQGQMISARTATTGSAGYVAIEAVHGVLAGRSGAFVLQHSGLMHRGAQELTLVVVPDSGTGELVGLAGRMGIINTGGEHEYTFDYWFSE